MRVIMKHSTDVVVHINEDLDKAGQLSFTNKIHELDGVLSANLTKNRPHLMIVGYDSNRTKSLDVLSGVNNNGVHAQLVGWL
jgi:hypothetical protein